MKKHQEKGAISAGNINMDKLEKTLKSIETSIGALVNIDDPHSILRTIAEQVRQIADIEECSIILFENEKKAIVVASSEEPEIKNTAIDISNYPELNRVIETRKPLFIGDVHTSQLLSEVREVLDRKNIQSIAVLPISAGDEMLGVLFLRMGRTGDLSQEIPSTYFQAIANAAALALKNLMLKKDVVVFERQSQHAREEAEIERKYRMRYQDLFHLASDGLVIIDRKGRVIDINRKFETLTGLIREDVDKLIYLDLVADEDKTRAKAFFVDYMKNPGPRRGYFKILTKSKQLKHAMIGVELLAGAEGQALLSIQDITEEKNLQQQLQRSKEFFENLINSSVDAIIAADVKGNIIVFNQGAERITGYKADEVIGKINIVDLYTPGAAKDVMRKLRSPEYGGVGKLETTHYTVIGKTGEEIPLNVSAAVIYENGKGIATVGIFQDLRPRIAIEKSLREAQMQLIESEKQSALAALSGAAAHELNQPLTSILGYSELLQSILTDVEPSVQRAVSTIVKESERMSEIIKKISRVSQYRTMDYVGRTRILDIDNAANPSSRYENLFLSMRDGLLEFKYDENLGMGECVFANPSVVKLLGRSEVSDVLGMKVGDLFGDEEISKKILNESMAAGGGSPIIVRLMNRDRSETIIEMLANFVKAKDLPPAIELLCRDITERVKAQEELEDAERRYRALIEMADEVGLGIVMLSLDKSDRGEVIFANKRFEKILGCKVAEMRTFPLLNLIRPEDRGKFNETFEMASGEDVGVYYIESGIVRRDGKMIPIEFHASATRYMGKKVIIGFVRDISEWVKTRDELQSLKEFSESIVNNAPIGIITMNADGVITSINDKEREIMGLPSKDHVVGANMLELSTIAGTQIEQFVRRGLSGERISISRLPFTSIVGKSMILRAEGVPLKDENGEVYGGIILLDDVTEEAELEESLRRERVYHDSLIEHSPAPILGLSVGGTIVMFNSAAEALTGYSRDEALGKNAFDIFGLRRFEPEEADRIIRSAIDRKTISDILTVIPAKHGKMIEIVWNAVPVMDDKNNLTGIVGIGRDVTEERRLVKETARRRKVLSAMHALSRASIGGVQFRKLANILRKEMLEIMEFDLLAMTLLKGDKLEFRNLYSKDTKLPKHGLFGLDGTYTEELINTRKPRLVKDFENIDNIKSDDRQIKKIGIRSCINAPLIHQDRIIGTLNIGSKKPDAFSEEEYRIFNQIADEFALALENIQLVEQLFKSNYSLERKTLYLEALLNAGRTFRIDMNETDVVLHYARDIEKLFPSPHLMIYLRDPEKDILLPAYNQQLPPEKTESPLPIEGNIEKWLKDKKDYFYFKSLKNVNKSYRPFLPDAGAALVIPIRVGAETFGLLFAESHHTYPFEQDAIDLIVLMARQMANSINNLRLFEQTRMLERSQEDIIENAGALIVAINREGIITIFNKTFETYIGYPKKDLIGRRAYDIFKILRQRNTALKIWENVKDGKELRNFSINLPTKNGKLVKAVFNSTALRDTRGSIVQYIFVGYDLSERETLEKQLIQSAKMATIGNMAASIAHELNNPLTAISSYAQILMERIRSIGGMKKEVDQISKINDGATRIERLIGHLMDYSRMDFEEPRPLSVNDVIEEALAFSEYDLSRGDVKIERRFKQELPPVNGVGSQLQQVFLNILTNASYVMQKHGGGKISIRTGLAPQRMVRVDIGDTGPGIPPEQIEQIFDPFFTTKPRGQGTGLGLSIVMDIVKKHGGHILVKSKPGQGSVFSVVLPAWDTNKDKEHE